MTGRDTRHGQGAPGVRPPRAPLAAVLGVVTSAAGIARDLAIAAIFRRDETDTFFVAFTLPSAFRVLADGMTSRGIAPVVSRKLRKEGEDAARIAYSRLRGAYGGLLVLVTAAGIVLAQPITELLAAGYRRRYGEFERTVWLTMTLFPYLLFAGLAAIGAVALHVKKRAGVTSLWTRLAFSASVLAATLVLPGLLDARGFDRTQALAAGVLVGGFLPLVLEWRARRAMGWTAPAVIDLRVPEIRDVARRVAPIAVALGPFYLELFVSRRLLSEMRPGAQSAFWWAMRICEMVQGLVAAAVATAPLRASPQPGESDADANARATSRRLRLALFASIPAAILVSVLAQPIVVAALQRGAFDASASYETARALAWQGTSIWMVAVLHEVASGFYGANDTRTPALLGLAGAAVFVGVALGLRGRMGHPAISAALVASSATQLVLAIPLLMRALPPLKAAPILGSAARTLGASLLALAIAATSAWALSADAGSDAFSRFLPGAVGVALFGASFFFTARGLRSPELDLVVRSLRRRWRSGRGEGHGVV
jgi:putative peptidoglycan lipid II flippase